MKKSSVILIWGIGTGLLSTIFYQILNAKGMENAGIKEFNLLITFLGVLIGTMQFRDKANGGYLTFGEGYKAGFLMFLIITGIAIISIIADLQIFPDLASKIQADRLNALKDMNIPSDQMEMRVHIVKLFTTPTAIVIFVIIGNLVSGAIFSLIAAGLATKQKPIFEDADEMPNNETNN